MSYSLSSLKGGGVRLLQVIKKGTRSFHYDSCVDVRTLRIISREPSGHYRL